MKMKIIEKMDSPNKEEKFTKKFRNDKEILKLNKKGFTLIEVLATVVIIAVLGFIAVPNVITTINNSKSKSYNIIVQDITISAQKLYEELAFVKSEIYEYNNNGKTGTRINIKTETTGNPNFQKTSVTVNLQTLVSNGFLTGINNSPENTTNKNPKIIENPKTNKDIGECSIIITKEVDKSNNYKTSYTITNNSESDSNCPSTLEYRNGVQ